MLPGFINERAHNKLSVSGEGAIEHILSAKVWLYGFERVSGKNLTDFLLVVYLFFCNHINNEYQQF